VSIFFRPTMTTMFQSALPMSYSEGLPAQYATMQNYTPITGMSRQPATVPTRWAPSVSPRLPPAASLPVAASSRLPPSTSWATPPQSSRVTYFEREYFEAYPGAGPASIPGQAVRPLSARGIPSASFPARSSAAANYGARSLFPLSSSLSPMIPRMLEATDYRVPDRPDPVAQAYAAAEEIARQLGLPQDDWERKGWLRHSRHKADQVESIYQRPDPDVHADSRHQASSTRAGRGSRSSKHTREAAAASRLEGSRASVAGTDRASTAAASTDPKVRLQEKPSSRAASVDAGAKPAAVVATPVAPPTIPKPKPKPRPVAPKPAAPAAAAVPALKAAPAAAVAAAAPTTVAPAAEVAPSAAAVAVAPGPLVPEAAEAVASPAPAVADTIPVPPIVTEEDTVEA